MSRNPRSPARLGAALLLVALSAGPAPAAPAKVEEPETRVFVVRFRAVEDVVLLLRPLLGEDGILSMQPRLRAVTVTDLPERIDRMAVALHEFDVAPRRVHLAVQLLLGTRPPADETEARGSPSLRVLPGIDAPLRDALVTTRWTDYRLLGSASFTASEGEVSQFSLGEEYRVELEVDTVSADAGVTRFRRFALERNEPLPGGGHEFRPVWDTVLNLRDNQLYVFGATRLEDARRAVFLSITAGIER